MAKQTDIHRGISSGYASLAAGEYLDHVDSGLYGKLPSVSGLGDTEMTMLAAIDGLAGHLAAQTANAVPMTADQLRVKLLRQIAERILRDDGDIRGSYEWQLAQGICPAPSKPPCPDR